MKKLYLMHAGGGAPCLVLSKTLQRGRQRVHTIVAADAWDCRFIRDAIERFLLMAAGRRHDDVELSGAGPQISIRAAPYLVALVGPDGLMDFSLAEVPRAGPTAPPRSSMLMACASRQYFGEPLARGGSHTLLLTTNLMAPEAYILDAAITAFVKGAAAAHVRDATATAYSRYQHITVKAAQRLFWSAP